MQQYNFAERYQDACLSRLKQNPEVMQTLHGWAKNPKNILFFHGNVGTGKTYFCSALYNLLLEKQQKKKEKLEYPFLSIRAYAEHAFFNELKEIIQMNWNPVYQIEKICDCDYLILDDLGSSKMTEWQIEMLSYLIDLRYSNKRPTLITSNLGKEGIKTVFPARVYDRLFAVENTIVEQNECTRRDDLNFY